MYFDKGGRQYWIAESLIDKGYKPTIFCASTNHFTNEHINTNGRRAIKKAAGRIPFVFINAPKYKGNGIKRILNILSFYFRLFPVAKKYARVNGTPDVIIAASAHPLTLLAGIKIGKSFGVPVICEVRDLLPESIVAYGLLRRNSIMAKALYQLEKYIYMKADSIVMTWEGGRQYIIDRGWENKVDLGKVRHISNGTIIDEFDKNTVENEFYDPDLDNKSIRNIVYAGSIRRVNNIGLLLEAAGIIQGRGHNDIRFLIYGSGNESEALVKRCIDEGIGNVIFKGRVEKKYIPSILTKAHINILHNSSTCLDKYGQSQNKLFEYLAAGKCIVQTYTTGYSILDKYACGLSALVQTPEEIADTISRALDDNEKYELMGLNARKAAYDFDFRKLTGYLIDIIEGL